MFTPFASKLAAGATLTTFLVAAATPSHADVPAPPPGAPGVVFQGPVQVVPVPPPPVVAPGYQGYPQAYPQGYPQGYPQQAYPAPAPGTYPPGYAPAYPYPPVAPPPLVQLTPRTPLRYESRPMYSLIIAGAITFGSAYLLTAGITGYINALDCSGSSRCTGTYWPLYIPAVGPLVYMGVGDKTVATVASPVFIVSSLAQLGGLAMLIAGALVRKKVPVYSEDAARLTVAPYFSPTSSGMQAMGRF